MSYAPNAALTSKCVVPIEWTISQEDMGSLRHECLRDITFVDANIAAIMLGVPGGAFSQKTEEETYDEDECLPLACFGKGADRRWALVDLIRHIESRASWRLCKRMEERSDGAHPRQPSQAGEQ